MRRAFTLVEIMVVVLILGIIALIAMPNSIAARQRGEAGQCIANLHQIEGGKSQWQLDTGSAATATPTQANLLTYMRTFPACPIGGTYSIGTMLVRPTCSIGGTHVLP
jgi:prepilin-type N-terminal cleavage/methylation domain-containing protein